jgi:selenide,water dikinase
LVPPPWRHHLLLAGGGHTHALLLRRWLMRPSQRPTATWVTLVSRHGSLCYSGLVPAVLAGLHPPSACLIDLRRLCSLAGVAFVEAEILGVDLSAGSLSLEGRPPLAFDLLSLDVGALTPPSPGALGVKPLEPLLRWCENSPPSHPNLRGGGASAVEVALALRARGLHPRLLTRGSHLHLGSKAAERLALRLLAQAAIPLHPQAGEGEPADLACTGSHAPPWLAAAGLAVDPASGRVLTHPTLQALHHPRVFASGDCGLIASDPRPPSGVWAVRAAPALAANLRRALEGRPLRAWRPQRLALQLLGDGGFLGGSPRALAFWGPFAFGPSFLLWRWKHQLDQRFLDSFTALRPMASPKEAPMACRGCAAKLPAQPLRSALARLAAMESPHQPPPPPEDAPVSRRLPGGECLLQSVDGFPALVSDPWLNGRLTTLHACGDLWASGADVESAQVVVTLPVASPALQEELLLHTLAGVRSVLHPLGARLLGGHTLEGRDGAGLGLSLTINGLAPASRHWAKGPLRPGDALLLSRPIGTGVLFAAAMVGAARAEWLDGALRQMQTSQASLVELLAAHGCHACTDITGFGLLGHLGEMLAVPANGPSAGPSPPAVMVDLEAAAIPVFPGARELLERGYASTLAPANAEALSLLNGPVRWRPAEPADAPPPGLWIDPQTCGPLLAALPGAQAPAALQALRASGFAEARLIGVVRPHP